LDTSVPPAALAPRPHYSARHPQIISWRIRPQMIFWAEPPRYDTRVNAPTVPRTLALDVGDRRIGIAITDRLGVTIQARPTLARTSDNADVEHLRIMIRDEQVEQVVVGLPLHMSGHKSPQCERVEAFAARLREVVDTPLVFQDERLTSFAAEQALEELGMDWRERRKRVDAMAARLILEDFLSRKSERR